MGEETIFIIKIVILMILDFGFGVMTGFGIWGRNK